MTGFDREAYETALDDVQKMLADLAALDDFFDHQRAIGGDTSHAGLGRLQLLHLGKVHPFEVSLWFPEPGHDVGRWQREYEQLVVANQEWARGATEECRALASDLVRVDVEALRGAVSALDQQVAARLDGLVIDDFAQIERTLSHWEGDSARAFEGFYRQLDSMAATHALAARDIASQCAGVTGSIAMGQLAARNAVEAARALLDAQLRGWAAQLSPPASPPSPADVVSVASTVSGIVALVPGPQQAVAGTVSSILGMVSAAIPEDDKEQVSFEAMRSVGIWTDLRLQLYQLTQRTTERISVIGTAKTEPTVSLVVEMQEVGSWYPRRVDLTDRGPGSWDYTG